MSSQRPSILVLGAGSIGRRHARNLLAVGASVSLCDPDHDRASSVAGASATEFDPDRFGTYDGIVVATPTNLHHEHVRLALAAGGHVLVEKPLVSTPAELHGIESSDRIMVGYNLRLHDPVRRAMAAVHDGRVGRPLLVRLWFGWYLPYWRPGVDYRDTYSARADLGGGILLDATHELDLLVWLLDERLDVKGAELVRAGDLDIDVEDTVVAVLQHEDGAIIELSLDYLSRRYRRGFEIVGEEATLRLDWARATLEVEDARGVETEPVGVPVDRSYEEEARRFLAFISDGQAPPVGAAEGAASVRLADRIRTFAR